MVPSMESSDPEYDARLRTFQVDLSRPSEEIVQKHILTGSPVALTPDDYFALRHEVALYFCIQPVEVVLVGSCRIGFTLTDKPMKNRPRFSRLQPGSDLDLVVVSAQLFDQLWDAVFDYSRTNSAFSRSPEATKFRNMLFRGWVDPRGMPPGRRFDLSNRWVQFFDGLGRDRRFGNRRASARVYRDWLRLAAYQQIAVDQCKRAFERQPG
jgi:hypothetical protein